MGEGEGRKGGPGWFDEKGTEREGSRARLFQAFFSLQTRSDFGSVHNKALSRSSRIVESVRDGGRTGHELGRRGKVESIAGIPRGETNELQYLVWPVSSAPRRGGEGQVVMSRSDGLWVGRENNDAGSSRSRDALAISACAKTPYYGPNGLALIGGVGSGRSYLAKERRGGED